ncbi:FAD-binding dehydrogenase [Oceanicella actignis]|uniref:FAD-binding dehydrogenase n=1 Tax=Oceanicella actignis TaxID=1189325 RepID=UPI0011E86F86|nr:FAD-binding dehydrogenase [Oceanicella actignis]TYO89622.1 hypothetical protein LY05_01612 [Oceanicella actignis]
METERADVLVIGAGLAGMTAAAEAAEAGRKVILLDQEGPQSLGGQAFWSFGGLFLVDSPEQRRMGVRDSRDLALRDWLGTAGFHRPEDRWPRAWAEAYVDFAAGEKRAWLRERGVRFFPVVGWAERGGHDASGPGNSVPRFHVAWGTGPALVEALERRLRAQQEAGRLRLLFRRRVDEIVMRAGAAAGAQGAILAPDEAPRGAPTNRRELGAFAVEAEAVILASGGVGGDLEKVRALWPERLGPAPRAMLSGVPAHVDGRGIEIAAAAGARLINRDRMWHYVEGVRNWAPIWPAHGIRILPGPSSMWFDAFGRRLEAPYLPGFDTLGTLERILRTGRDHSWFVLTQKIIRKEFALSGSEQNPDLTGRSWRMVARRAVGRRAPGPVEAFKEKGADFIVREDPRALVEAMNAMTGEDLLDPADMLEQIAARDAQLDNPFCKDAQIMAIRNARRYRGDRLIRTAPPHKLLDPANGPLIAVRLNILTRKTLGGIETDLQARALGADGAPMPGLFAAGEAAGFGGGGLHGARALEGTFLGGCIFSGRAAGRAAAGRS